jgi:hypothetical protein
MSVTVFGIRHHGPGCARSLRRALDESRPDIVVLEGPPDAEGVLSWVSHGGMKPPVALLVYPMDEPQRAVYYPLAVFSPEWQTLAWAAANGVPVRFMDLPQSHQLALDKEAEETAQTTEAPNGLARFQEAEPPGKPVPTAARTEPRPPKITKPHSTEAADEMGTAQDSATATSDAQSELVLQSNPTWQTDPVAIMAEAAGYKDHELWWEEQIERRSDATSLFAAIHQAMSEVRAAIPEVRPRDLQREAYMRKTVRAVLKAGFKEVAVVCGAWHAPVLDAVALAGKRPDCKIGDDNDRVSGLPKLKTTATWIPWTYSRLTYRSGYGAGIHSPGWYGLLWESHEQAPTCWLVTAARLLRGKDLDASSASVIEARRLADALAAMRELCAPGLAELNEAVLAVLCHGEPTPLSLIRAKLEIGDVLGEVPTDAPTVPLAQDLAKLQTTLRFKPSTEIKRLDLDLRRENDLARSRLLHRLTVLEIPWGRLEETRGTRSTFHEVWLIEWKPDFAVALIEANVWGNTIESAATARVIHNSKTSSELSSLTSLFEASILASLENAIEPVLRQIQAMAAVGADVRHLMDALLPMARVARYGDVRGTGTSQVLPIFQGMFERAIVGLAAACSALDDDAAARMVASMSCANEALQILNRADLQTEWRACLDRLMRKDAHALVRGWCCRLLVDAGALAHDELYRLARLSLSSANPPSQCASWATGLLKGSGLALLHHEALWQVFDRWLCELGESDFVEMLPLLRRAFADFTGPERRQMGEKVKNLRASADTVRTEPELSIDSSEVDHKRAARVLPILAHILGSK